MASTKIKPGEIKNPKGRPKGSQNKTTALLKDAIIQAANDAHADGMAGYLQMQANANPVAFMGLLGKVLPMQIAGDPDNPLRHITTIELVGPSGDSQG